MIDASVDRPEWDPLFQFERSLVPLLCHRRAAGKHKHQHWAPNERMRVALKTTAGYAHLLLRSAGSVLIAACESQCSEERSLSRHHLALVVIVITNSASLRMDGEMARLLIFQSHDLEVAAFTLD